MVHLLRKYQQSLLIAVTVLVIASFIWYWNGTQSGRAGLAGSPKIASIYGQNISQNDIQRDVRKFQIAAALGLDELVQGLAGNATSQQQVLENYIWNSYVFQHEADTLQVFPTDSEVQKEYSRVPAFQTDGNFDPNKLTEFVNNVLPSRGFNDAVIDDLLREQVRVRKVKALLAASVDITPAELLNRYIEENQKMNISVVRLNLSDLENGITVTDDAVKKDYDAHKDTYLSEEQRKVAVASFELSDAQKKLKGKERTEALQKVADDAGVLAEALAAKGADFDALAKKQGGQLKTTGFFTAAKPDPAIADIPALGTAAFHLSSDAPSSDVIEGPDGYYLLHLVGSIPSRQVSLEEARPEIVAKIKKEQASQLLQTKANELRTRILLELKAGHSFADAAKDAGAQVEAIPPFNLMDISKKTDVPDLQVFIQPAVALADGQLSDFVPTEAGGLLIYMNGRQTMDKLGVAIASQAVKEQFARQQQLGAFIEWLRLRKDAAHLQIVQRSS